MAFVRENLNTKARQETALADLPALRTWLDAWREKVAETGYAPWLILALAVFLRFFLLGIKPPHFDEGINGWFVDQMVKNGFYRYDPTNYHGPLHFYVLFLSQTLLGRNIWALRLPVVVISCAGVWLTLKFETVVGRTVSRVAALAMAVSPAFVFYGRYSIHEAWMLFFSMLFIFGGLNLWKFGTRNYLWCTGMGLAGMILTKETYIIHVICALIAAGVCFASHKFKPLDDAGRARQSWDILDLAMVIATGVALIVFFYSGTFFHWTGLRGLYEAYQPWFATGNEGHGHEKPWYYWLKIMAPSFDFSRADCLGYELPALAGLALCLLGPWIKNLAVRYLAIYGVGTFAVYSYVRYKTPWCIISIIWPFLFVFAAAITVVSDRYRKLISYISAALIAISLVSSVWLNYFHCTTDTEPYVYVQTYNDIFKLTDPLLSLAHRDPIFYQLTGHIIRTSAYPLPWILDDFPKIGYYEHTNSPGNFDADFLLVEEDRVQEVEGKLHDSYYTEPLRIRASQDTSTLFFNARVFRGFFPGRAPNFVGKPAAQPKQ